MGKSTPSGPVYGAKGCLLSFGPVNYSNGTTGLVTSIVVPPYESWYLTEVFQMQSQATSNSSLAKSWIKVKGTPTADPAFPAGNPGTAGSVTGPTSTAAYNVVGTLSVTPGEYEGYCAPANSTIRFVCSGTIGLLYGRINGFIRYLSSTRAE